MLHRPPEPRSRARSRAKRPVEVEAEAPIVERRLERAVRTLRGHSLLDYLRVLPKFERHAARLVLIRELGARPAGEVMAAAFGGGRSLPSHLRAPLVEVVGEAALAARLHEGEEASRLAAAHGGRALTVGDQIFLGAGASDFVIAHEVAHVAQGRRGSLQRAAAKAVDGSVADAAEAEADLAAQLVVARAEKKAAPPAAAPATGMAESEAQRSAQLAAQEARLTAAQPAALETPATEPPPTPVAAEGAAAPASAAPPPANEPSAAKDGAHGKLFAAAPSKQAERWTTVGNEATDELRGEEREAASKLPKLPARLEGGEAAHKTAAGADAKAAQVELPAAEAAPSVAPKPAPPAPPLPKNPAAEQLGTQVPSEDKAQVEAAGKQAIDAISTKDPEPPRKPGPAPVVELCGEADPLRAASAESEGVAQSQQEAELAKEKIVRGPGAPSVQPKKLDEKLEVPAPEAPPALDSPPPVEGMAELRGYKLDAQVSQAFDEIAKPKLEAQLTSARAQLGEASARRERERAAKIAAAHTKSDEANREAAAKQSKEVQSARKAIVDEQKATVGKQQAAVADLKKKSGLKRGEANTQIDTRVKADQQKIQTAYKEANDKAQAEHQKGEEEAKKKKEQAKEQSKDKSWWQRAKAAVCDAIKAVADAVCAVLAAVRDAVCRIIDAVKDLACKVIDAARDFIKNAIGVFGNWLKSAITGLLGTLFPELAARLNAFIDKAVDAAKRAVDAVADGLKKGITLLAEGLKKAVTALVSAWQGIVKGIAALATALVTGDWKAVARMVLEGILKIIGVDPKAFWGLIAKAEDSLKKIVDQPGAFARNLVEAVKQGFSKFADNFWTHLKNGLVSWLFNTLSSAGVTMPSKLDAAGVFHLTCQVLGLTEDKLRQKAVKLVGEKNVERVEKVWALVKTAMGGGFTALWDKVKQDLAGLENAVIDPIKTYLQERVLKAAVLKIASLFNPAGAIAQLILTAWNVYVWLRDNSARIFGLVVSIVDSIAEIVAGNLGKAATLVEKSLAQLVPIAIGFLASLLGLGGLDAKIKEIMSAVQKRIDDAIDKFIQRLMGQAKGGDDKKKAQEKKPTEKTLSMHNEPHTLFAVPNNEKGYDLEMASSNRGFIRQKIIQSRKLAQKIASANNQPSVKSAKPLSAAILQRFTALEGLVKRFESESKKPEYSDKLRDTMLQKIAEKLDEIGKRDEWTSLDDAADALKADKKTQQISVPSFSMVTEHDELTAPLFTEYKKEFRRQVLLQMQGLNSLTVAKWVGYVNAYGNRKRKAEKSGEGAGRGGAQPEG